MAHSHYHSVTFLWLLAFSLFYTHKQLQRPPDMNYSHLYSPQGNHRRNNKIGKDRQSNAITQHQMIMQLHHQRHQITLKPNVNVNGLKMNRHTTPNNPPNVDRNEIVSQMQMQYKKRGRKKKNLNIHRHMSEPSNIMQNMAQYNQFKMNNDNNPLSESDDLVPITFMQGENLSRSSNSRVRSKSHPSKPVKNGESGEWMDTTEFVGFVINNDKSPALKIKKKKKKHKKRKRKSSTPTIKKKDIIRHRQNNDNKLRPPVYHKDKHKHNKYYDNYYYSDRKKRELHQQNSANSNLTNNTLTPIPNEINSNSIISGHSHKKTISMTPINIDLINKSINNEFKSRDSPNKSSAMVPPPPSCFLDIMRLCNQINCNFEVKKWNGIYEKIIYKVDSCIKIGILLDDFNEKIWEIWSDENNLILIPITKAKSIITLSKNEQ